MALMGRYAHASAGKTGAATPRVRLAAVHCARTTALQLLDNRSEAFVKVLAVCLAVLHGESARERRLPPRSGGLWCGLPAFGGG